jgi:hypothetical protein
MKPFDSTSYTIAHRPLHAWVVAPGNLSAPHSGARMESLRRVALGVDKPGKQTRRELTLLDSSHFARNGLNPRNVIRTLTVQACRTAAP